MRVLLLPVVLALSVVASCGPRDWEDQERVWKRLGDTALIGSPAFRRELLRSVSQQRAAYDLWSREAQIPTDVTDRFIDHDTARFCAIGAREKGGHRAWQNASVLPPDTAEGWANWALEDAALVDTCGLRLFVQARDGRPTFTAVFNVLESGAAVRRRTISGPDARLIVIAAPKGSSATFPVRAARLARALIPQAPRPDLEAFWRVDGGQAVVASADHRRALLDRLKDRLSLGHPVAIGQRTTELTATLIDLNLAPLCATSAEDKRSFEILASARLSADALGKMRRDLLASCGLRIFGQTANGQTRLVAVYTIEGAGGPPQSPRLRDGPFSLDVVVFDPAPASL